MFNEGQGDIEMKLYFAKKPNHTNINGIYYPDSVLRTAVIKLNEEFKDRPAPFILHAENPITMPYALSNMVGSLGVLQFDDAKQMYDVEVLAITEAYRTIIEAVGEENFLIDCVAYTDITPNGNEATKIRFDNRFWLIEKSETNL